MDQLNTLIDQYERLFAEAGWKELVADLKEKRDILKETTVLDRKLTERDLAFNQGVISQYDYIISLENIVDALKQEAKYNANFQTNV